MPPLAKPRLHMAEPQLGNYFAISALIAVRYGDFEDRNSLC